MKLVSIGLLAVSSLIISGCNTDGKKTKTSRVQDDAGTAETSAARPAQASNAPFASDPTTNNSPRIVASPSSEIAAAPTNAGQQSTATPAPTATPALTRESVTSEVAKALQPGKAKMTPEEASNLSTVLGAYMKDVAGAGGGTEEQGERASFTMREISTLLEQAQQTKSEVEYDKTLQAIQQHLSDVAQPQ